MQVLRKKKRLSFFQNLVSFHFCLQREMYEDVYFIGHFGLILWEKCPNDHLSRKKKKMSLIYFIK